MNATIAIEAIAQHHTDTGLIDILMHGFLWRIGANSANTLFHIAPNIIAPTVAAFLLYRGWRWLRRRT